MRFVRFTSRVITSSATVFTLLAAFMFLAVSTFSYAEPTATLDTFEGLGGETFFAARLSADKALPAAKQHNIVILFDTSASQTAAYREKAFASLDGLLSNLSATDRVKLIAVDTSVAVMTEGFVASNSDALREAKERLLQREPLGATDMELAMSTAADALQGTPKAGRVAMYIGDGISTANVLQGKTLEDSVKRLTTARIPLSSYAIGPRTDGKLLAVLANRTGGNLYVAEAMLYADKTKNLKQDRAQAENLLNGKIAGERLAAWSQAAVAWPSSLQLPANVKEVYPKQVPPLRSDRTTILIGSTTAPIPSGKVFQTRLQSSAGEVDMPFALVAGSATPDNTYLSTLVESARRDAGATLPTVGDEGLAEVRRSALREIEQLTDIAEQAAVTGNSETANQLAQAVLRRDPNNIRARTAQRVAARLGSNNGPNRRELRLVAQPGGNGIGELVPAGPASNNSTEGSFLDEHLEQNAVVTELIKKEVELALDDARNRMSDDPDSVIQDLKLTLLNITRAPELDAKNTFRSYGPFAIGFTRSREPAIEPRRNSTTRPRTQTSLGSTPEHYKTPHAKG